VYDRNVNGRELNFEASGALLQASLVMRDRETDSWWSIMTATSIGGQLDDTRLTELPVGRKMTWGEWVAIHPDTKILSVRGQEHVRSNPFDSYFRSDETFRGLVVEDKRLPAKEPVYVFHLDGGAFAAAHSSFEGGHIFDLGVDDRAVLLYREPGLSFYASSEAYLVPGASAGRSTAALLERSRSGDPATERLNGFDTFWYSWVAVNQNSALLE